MTETAGGGSRVNRVRVIIGGDEYTLRTDEPAKHVERLAARVDRDLSDLAERFPGVPRERLAVLLALRLTGQLEKARDQVRAARKPRPEAPVEPERYPTGSAPIEAAAVRETAASAEPSVPAGTSLFDPPKGDPAL